MYLRNLTFEKETNRRKKINDIFSRTEKWMEHPETALLINDAVRQEALKILDSRIALAAEDQDHKKVQELLFKRRRWS